MVSSLWSGVLLPFATAALLAYVGILTARRRAGPQDRFALACFALWWFSASAVLVLSSMPTLLDALGVVDIRVYTVLVYAIAVPLAVALWSLLYYLSYVYTGRNVAFWPLTVAYAAFFAFEVYYFSLYGTRHLETTVWSVRTVGESIPSTGLRALFGIAVAGPVLGAIAAYAFLYFRTHERAARFRIGLVSLAFLVWFAPILVGFLAHWDAMEWFALVYEIPGVIASAMILVAFKPPRAIRTGLEDAGWSRTGGPAAPDAPRLAPP